MPGKGSKIIADDYNAIQKRVAAVLGAGGVGAATARSWGFKGALWHAQV